MMTLLLKPAELLYRGVNRVRRALYRAGALKAKRLPRPVISIGNIAIGGAGKTPAVICIAGHLAAAGLRVAVLTRGYGRADAKVTGRVDSLDAARWGDEPVLIKSHLDNVDVLVGSNRYQNAVQYLHENQCDVFLLDDGFQHLQLARDADVVIDVPGARFHREGRSALRDATFVVPRKLRLRVPAELKRVFAFAGLADNEQFFAALRSAGLEVTGTRGFPDHHRYTADDVAALRRDAMGVTLVTTEKDFVKLGDRDIIPLPAELEIGGGVLEQLLHLVRAHSEA
ncbi:MAG TPA: tetraacyldisaccharide 4'-kinase [Thermoanaerobaculia bacterium]|jgi:tetraacyldisaccharide 4'-kinase